MLCNANRKNKKQNSKKRMVTTNIEIKHNDHVRKTQLN